MDSRMRSSWVVFQGHANAISDGGGGGDNGLVDHLALPHIHTYFSDINNYAHYGYYWDE